MTRPSHFTHGEETRYPLHGIQELVHMYMGANSPQPDPTEKQLKGGHFSSDAEVIAAAETWLDGQTSELFLSGLQKLEFGRCSFFPFLVGLRTYQHSLILIQELARTGVQVCGCASYGTCSGRAGSDIKRGKVYFETRLVLRRRSSPIITRFMFFDAKGPLDNSAAHQTLSVTHIFHPHFT